MLPFIHIVIIANGFALGNKCFKFVEGDQFTGVTWDDALATCRRGIDNGLNPDIASIHSELENGKK